MSISAVLIIIKVLFQGSSEAEGAIHPDPQHPGGVAFRLFSIKLCYPELLASLSIFQRAHYLCVLPEEPLGVYSSIPGSYSFITDTIVKRVM
jgi:hypothetical protein